MKINSINKNYQNNNTNFNGKFKNNELLNKSLEKASDYDLKKFGSLLRRMKAQNDNFVFSIDSSKYDLNAYYKNLEIELLKSGEQKLTVFPVGKQTKRHEDEFTDNVFNNVIKKINKKLEEIYPEQEITKAKRENSLAKIYKNLD